ncbi:porin [Pseudoduganella namucuonensis]|uniref:Outer membrane protein (Porin) n=1 Tax=Pseudoduganella namucuonensis TaxID=1035707 RepID=A0A1I7J4K3_9BURK|nr:porin [Pseudoduganella namucuonensis]SFU80084.1 Outer membrane protein (porin) [Pseudoduganella namucuonensis]
MKTPYWMLALLSPLAAGAQNPSAVTVYGVLDAGVVAERGCAGECAGARIGGGVASESRLGVRGREALNQDVAAVFTLEAGVQADTGASDPDGKLFGRQAFVGLDSRWGALTLGRQYNLQYETLVEVADPFHGGMAGTATNLAGYVQRRYDNTIKYVTPTVRGWSAGAIYAFGESPYSSKFNRAYGATIGYEHAPFNIRIAHQRKYNLSDATGVVPAVDYSSRNTLVAANVVFKSATLYAAYGVNRGIGSSPWDPSYPYGALVVPSASDRSHDIITGVSLPRGAATFMVSYIHKNDRTLANRDADQLAAGVSYAMSRRTSVYAAYARIKNRNGAGYTVGNASSGGRGDSAVNVGLRHAF